MSNLVYKLILLCKLEEVPETLAYNFPIHMADLKSYFFPLDQAEVCNTRSLRVWRWTTSLFKSQNWLTFLSWWLVWLLWSYDCKRLNKVDNHCTITLSVIGMCRKCWKLSNDLLLRCYIHSARRMTIPSSNSTRKPWEQGYMDPIDTSRYLVWYELVLQRYSCQTSSTSWYKNVRLKWSQGISFKTFFQGRGGWGDALRHPSCCLTMQVVVCTPISEAFLYLCKF